MGVYTAQWGFDQSQRERAVELLQIDDDVRRAAEELQARIIRPNLTGIIDEFYGLLLDEPETAAFLTDDDRLRNLREGQARHLLTFGMRLDEEAYFEERLHIGVTHRRVGLPLSYYLNAYAHLQAILSRLIVETAAGDAEALMRLHGAMLKLMILDIQLAMTTYQSQQ